MSENELAPPKARFPHLDVYRWAQNLSGEQKIPAGDKDFIQTFEYRQIIRRLRLSQNNMIAVIANQGQGKTITAVLMSWELNQDAPPSADNVSYYFKWRGMDSIFEEIIESDDLEQYTSAVIEAGLKKLMGRSHQSSFLNNLFTDTREYHNERNRARKTKPRDYAEENRLFDRNKAILTKEELFKLQYDALIQKAGGGNITFFIDFPDYDKRSRAQMLRDIKIFREWWDSIVVYTREADDQTNFNLVIFFQKELWGTHFAFGKFDVIELKPFKAEQLTQHYKDMFVSTNPFNEDSLTYLGGLARGNIRWYKKYIRLCLENYYDIISETTDSPIIGVESVKSWISLDKLCEDWERELMDALPNSKGLRRKAVEIMRYLFENKDTTQNDLTNKLFSEGKSGRVRCSRLLAKLEEYGYLKRDHEGRENKISLRWA